MDQRKKQLMCQQLIGDIKHVKNMVILQVSFFSFFPET